MLVLRLVAHPLAATLRPTPLDVLARAQAGVQEARVAGIDAALDRLGEVAGLVAHRDEALVLGDEVPLDLRQARRLAARAHVRPDDAAALRARIADGVDLVLEVALRRLVRHVYALAGDV